MIGPTSLPGARRNRHGMFELRSCRPLGDTPTGAARLALENPAPHRAAAPTFHAGRRAETRMAPERPWRLIVDEDDPKYEPKGGIGQRREIAAFVKIPSKREAAVAEALRIARRYNAFVDRWASSSAKDGSARLKDVVQRLRGVQNGATALASMIEDLDDWSLIALRHGLQGQSVDALVPVLRMIATAAAASAENQKSLFGSPAAPKEHGDPGGQGSPFKAAWGHPAKVLIYEVMEWTERFDGPDPVPDDASQFRSLIDSFIWLAVGKTNRRIGIGDWKPLLKWLPVYGYLKTCVYGMRSSFQLRGQPPAAEEIAEFDALASMLAWTDFRIRLDRDPTPEEQAKHGLMRPSDPLPGADSDPIYFRSAPLPP